MKFIYIKTNELIVEGRLEIIGLYIYIQARRLLYFFLTKTSQLNVRSDKSKDVCRTEFNS